MVHFLQKCVIQKIFAIKLSINFICSFFFLSVMGAEIESAKDRLFFPLKKKSKKKKVVYIFNHISHDLLKKRIDMKY